MSELGTLLFLLGSALYLGFGLIHVVLVLWDEPRGRLFFPADKRLREDMKNASLTLSPRLSLLNTYRGLNVSHGLGASVFGLIGIYLASNDLEAPVSGALLAIYTVFALLNLTVALRYWSPLLASGYALPALLFLTAGALYWL